MDAADVMVGAGVGPPWVSGRAPAQICSFSTEFCAGTLPDRAAAPWKGLAAIRHRPLGVWHPQKRASADPFQAVVGCCVCVHRQVRGASTPVRHGDGCLNGSWVVSATQVPLKFEVISFNFGIHDVDYGGAGDDDAYQEEWVPLPLYYTNIRAIKRTLQATGAKVIFASSTPVPYNLTTNSRILAYNAAAKRVMAEEPAAAGAAHGQLVLASRRLLLGSSARSRRRCLV
jgi:hypothetical protein